jgi:hypothetical protein
VICGAALQGNNQKNLKSRPKYLFDFKFSPCFFFCLGSIVVFLGVLGLVTRPLLIRVAFKNHLRRHATMDEVSLMQFEKNWDTAQKLKAAN